VLLALFGLVAGQAVVWYTGQFYALFFLTKVLQVDLTTADILIAVALLIGTPFFVVFGALSDRVGRKPIIMAGLLLAVLTYFPLFHALTQAANPDLALAQAKAEVVVTAARRDCSFGGKPVARAIDHLVRHRQALSGPELGELQERVGHGRARHGAHRRHGHHRALGPGGGPGVRRRERGRHRRLQEAGERGAEGCRLPREGRPGQDEQAADRGHPGGADGLRGHGLRADRRRAGGAVPHPHPLHLDEPALPHRQRLVRRHAAHHRLPWWPPTATCTTACGIRSIAAATLVVGLLFFRETKDVDIYATD
jgi:hypothetical protein